MNRFVYDKPVLIQRQDPETEEFFDVLHLHARVNKSVSGSTPDEHGAEFFLMKLNFDFRFSKALRDVCSDPVGFRLVYAGHAYEITDVDDFEEEHRNIRIVGRRC